MSVSKSKDKLKQFVKNYWLYYRELEAEFLSTKRFVDFSKDNYNTYSIEFLKLYQAVCSEIDVVGKFIASSVNVEFKAEDRKNNIYKWWYEIQNRFYINEDSNILYKEDSVVEKTVLSEYAVLFMGSYKVKPWEKFEVEKYKDKNDSQRYRLANSKKVPFWWSDYNKVKHNRTSAISNNSEKINYSKANLGNLIYAFAALYILK